MQFCTANIYNIAETLKEKAQKHLIYFIFVHKSCTV